MTSTRWRSSKIGDQSVAVLLLVYGAAIALLVAVVLAAHVLDREFGDFAHDPTTTLSGPAYIGFLSNVGAVLWSATLAACVISALVLPRPARVPFLWGGAITFVLLADDLFLLHEAYFPHVGLSQARTSLLYGVSTLAFLVIYRRFVQEHGLILFPLALALFALSSGIDLSLEEHAPFVIEDGAKFLGIVTWCLFFANASTRELRSAIARADVAG